jgi:transglycosylase-like protein
MAGARQHRAEPGAQLRLTKGGAVRTRIALSTALAVLIAVPVLLFALSSNTPAAATRTRHEAGTRHRAARIDMKLMSYAQAEKATKLATFYNAVTTQEEVTYLKEIAYLKDIAYIRAMSYIAAVAAQESAAAARSQAATASLPVPASSGSDGTSTNTPDWACIRQHESNDNYSTGGGGAYQFELGTWEGLTGLTTPAEDSPPSVQDAAALRLYAERGWEPWTTRYVCGL